MLRPLHNNIVVKQKESENSSKIIFREANDEYEVINVADSLDKDLIGKTVLINTYLKKVDIEGITYYLVDYDDILAILE